VLQSGRLHAGPVEAVARDNVSPSRAAQRGTLSRRVGRLERRLPLPDCVPSALVARPQIPSQAIAYTCCTYLREKAQARWEKLSSMRNRPRGRSFRLSYRVKPIFSSQVRIALATG
jgi:hypothetical protein